MDILDLKRCSLEELEGIYASERRLEAPAGCFRGHHLAWLKNPAARSPALRLLIAPAFKYGPFGVDFDRSLWWFQHPKLALGAFTASAGPSRWRATDTLRLNYSSSRLPAPVRDRLYDEVKPLSESLCLGLGGVNAPRDRGDLFFFALVRL